MTIPPLPASTTVQSQGLRSLAVCNHQARAVIYLQGAHVAAWRPVGAEEGLWMSVRSAHEPGKPLRGGVPICFPWFGPHPSNPELPAHGFARLHDWSLEAAEDLPDGRTRLSFGLASSAATETLWPHRFTLAYTVTIGATLELELAVTNDGTVPFVFEEALHTYFGVGDVRRVSVSGLRGSSFIDKVAGAARKVEEATAITFTGETDRVYLATEASTTIQDASLGRRITVAKRGSRTTVVWNPWVAKAARMPDFGDEEWPGMVCVESANAADDRVELAPGTTHRLGVTITLGLA